MPPLSRFGAPMNAPRIGVTAVHRTWDGLARTGVNAAYLRAVKAAGGAPLILSPLAGADEAGTLLDACDGLLLTGGEDVEPALYGAEPAPQLGAVDPARDRFELALFQEARERGIPILAVCRGIQLVNVALGGTLWQDLPTERAGAVVHNAPGARNARTHAVRVREGSRIADAVGATRLSVNSFHHQAVRDLATGLVATAWADDGLIEGVEAEGGSWLLGVQWHPEEMHADAAAPDRGLFAALVREAVSARETGIARSPR